MAGVDRNTLVGLLFSNPLDVKELLTNLQVVRMLCLASNVNVI